MSMKKDLTQKKGGGTPLRFEFNLKKIINTDNSKRCNKKKDVAFNSVL